MTHVRRIVLAAAGLGPVLTAERLVQRLQAGETPVSFRAELDGWIAIADHARSHRLGDLFYSDEELLTSYREYVTAPPGVPGWSAFLRHRLMAQHGGTLRARDDVLGSLLPRRLSIPDVLDFAAPDSTRPAVARLAGALEDVPRLRLREGCDALCAATDARGESLLDRDQQAAVTQFLQRLPTTAEWARQPESVVALCTELFAAMRFSTRLRDAVASIAADATSSCRDNVGFGLDRIRLMLRFHQASGLAGKLEVLQQLHLHDIVMKETVRLYGSTTSNVDLLQRALAFTVRLRQLGFLQDGGIAETIYHAMLPESDYETVAIAAIEATPEEFAAFASRSGWLADDPEVNDPRYRSDLETIDETAYEALESTSEPTAMESIQATRLSARGEALSAAIARASERRETHF